MRESGTELGNINRLDAAVGVKAGEAVAGVITERIEVLKMARVYIGGIGRDMQWRR